jgi:hypothetical protein
MRLFIFALLSFCVCVWFGVVIGGGIFKRNLWHLMTLPLYMYVQMLKSMFESVHNKFRLSVVTDT